MRTKKPKEAPHNEGIRAGIEPKQQAPVFGLPWPLGLGIEALPKLGLSWVGLYLAIVLKEKPYVTVESLRFCGIQIFLN